MFFEGVLIYISTITLYIYVLNLVNYIYIHREEQGACWRFVSDLSSEIVRSLKTNLCQVPCAGNPNVSVQGFGFTV